MLRALVLKDSRSLCADDLAIWTTLPKMLKSHRRFMEQEYQDQIDLIQEFMAVNGFSLSADKTVLMIFSRRRKNCDKASYSIRVGDRDIKLSQEVI